MIMKILPPKICMPNRILNLKNLKNRNKSCNKSMRTKKMSYNNLLNCKGNAIINNIKQKCALIIRIGAKRDLYANMRMKNLNYL